jgi:DNA-binding CsgD family transcriptional regulator
VLNLPGRGAFSLDGLKEEASIFGSLPVAFYIPRVKSSIVTGIKLNIHSKPVNCGIPQVWRNLLSFERKTPYPMQSPGVSLLSFITNIPADLSSEEALQFKKTIPRFPEEAVYIYSFEKNRMVYADGWPGLLGYSDDEITLPTILTITAPEYAPFSKELNEKAFQFILGKTEELEKYSFSMELKKIHKNGSHIPVISKIGVFSSSGGTLTAIIGHFQVNRSMKLGKIMRYAAYGPGKDVFEEELNKRLFRHYAISRKEKEALSLLAKGHSFKEIAELFNVSISAIEKRVFPMYKRFEVRGLTHLISFAHDNHIL